MKKIRADRLLFERGLAPTLPKAKGLIMAGCVFSNEAKIAKPGELIDPNSKLIIKGEDHPYVSRGGVKLAHALNTFSINVAGRTCMDVGASTGGFTDCLLKNGAGRVYAIDVGYGQLAWGVANDKRVIVMDRTNIRKLSRENIPETIDIAVIDVSFISLSLVLSCVDGFLAKGASVVALVKPQFEVERGLVGRGGIVRDLESHTLAVEKIKSAGHALGFSHEGTTDSPILGAKGNKEFLIYFRKGTP